MGRVDLGGVVFEFDLKPFVVVVVAVAVDVVGVVVGDVVVVVMGERQLGRLQQANLTRDQKWF